MMSRLQMASYAACLLCGLASVSSKAWWQTAPEPREQYRHLMPMGHDFPGIPLPGAERVTQTIRFALHPRNLSGLRLDWHPRNRQGTGLYRVPGEPVTVSICPVGEEPQLWTQEQQNRGKRPQLLIGAHPWLPLTGKDGQGGDPESARQWLALLEDKQRDKGSAAGLMYIDASARGSAVFEITIEGAVRAPWFRLGRDSQEHWRQTIRHEPAPWAELEGQRAILTLPSSMIRDLDDPEPIIRFYDQLVQDVNSLVGLNDSAQDLRDRSPDLPFRLVLDPALSLPATTPVAATSGYPIRLNWMYYGDPWIWLQPDSPQVRALVLHELGHNYEPVDQLFEPPGAVEAFADLIQYGWQSRAGYTLLGSRTGWPGFKDDMYYAWLPLYGYPSSFYTTVSSERFDYDSRIWVEGSRVSWAQKHAFMIRLVSNLSHEFIAGLYHRFRHTPQEALPDKDDPQQKTDFFFELLCEVTGQDLTLFFQDWYVPVSAEASQRVAAKGYRVPPWVRHDEL